MLIVLAARRVHRYSHQTEKIEILWPRIENGQEKTTTGRVVLKADKAKRRTTKSITKKPPNQQKQQQQQQQQQTLIKRTL